MASKRVNSQAFTITLAPKLFRRVEDEAEELGMNRSAFIALCVSQYFRNVDALRALQSANDLVAKAQAEGVIATDLSQISMFGQEV